MTLLAMLYTPVRSDAVVGELRLSEPTNLILPELPQIEMLALTGKEIEGDIITALLQRVNLNNMFGESTRKMSDINGNSKSFEQLSSQHSCSYKVRLEDIGRHLRCECLVTDVFGRSSDPAYAETASVSPGIPKIDKLEIEGRGFHTNLYARGEGGKKYNPVA
ncbi:LOW QUALITY PROTEIN: hypothetical protein RJ640_018028 [Escallonia rubra]|uniref:Uncharacterized protein n=1 Tax=Escallonia rubra TaxID=112253 RepID=A0AA88URY8_9ASTE|nr:LOW QUALITY PROTEIN: hypothetical protein RJ640_018028 [Escallonia rubra]